MRVSSLLGISTAAVAVTASPVQFPLPDGFPNPSNASLDTIEKAAQGPLPDAPLPTIIKPAGATILQLLALNEIFEVAYFTQLLSNITDNVPGYEAEALAGLDRQYVIDAVTAIVAQEKLHAYGLNLNLANANQSTVQPCLFQTPVTNFTQAISLAATFTDIILGALPDAQTTFAKDGGDETPFVDLFGTVLGQEGQQAGFFRYAQGKTPSAAAFLTSVGPSFSYSALRLFIVPGSCAQAESLIDIPTFKPLMPVVRPEARNSSVTFSVDAPVSASDNSLVYLSGQAKPVTVPITPGPSSDGMYQFSASFPYDAGFTAGLTIAALVNGTGSFNSSAAVSAATIYGPGLIEVG